MQSLTQNRSRFASEQIKVDGYVSTNGEIPSRVSDIDCTRGKFFWIMWVKAEWTSPAQRQDIALLLLPLTAAYFVAIVRSAIDEKNDSTNGPPVNLFYLLVVITVTVITISALIFTIVQIPSAMVPTIDDARRTILIFEIAFGTAFGLIASDLFGKIENVQIPIGSLKDGA